MAQEARGFVPLVAVVALVAAGVALIYLETILMPFAVAFFLATLAGPLVTFMRRKRIPAGAAIVIIILVTGAAFFLLGQVFYSQVPEFEAESPMYWDKLRTDFEAGLAALPEGWVEVLDLEDLHLDQVLPGERVARFIASTLGSLLGVFGTILLILLYMVFILLERELIFFRLKEAFSEKESSRVIGIMEAVQKQTESYIAGKTLISLATGVLATFVLWIFGVKFFFLWGILTFLLNFVPNIGSTVATVLPLLMAYVQPDPAFSAMQIALLALLLLGVQFVIGSILEPSLLGRRLQLSPLVIFIAFIVWGWLWGIPGMILSTPIMVTIKTVMEHIDALQPVAILISDRRPEAAR